MGVRINNTDLYMFEVLEGGGSYFPEPLLAVFLSRYCLLGIIIFVDKSL